MKCFMMGQEKGDFLRQVTSWAGLTVIDSFEKYKVQDQ